MKSKLASRLRALGVLVARRDSPGGVQQHVRHYINYIVVRG